MSNQKPPKIEFSVDATRREYSTAALLVERQSGYLNLLPGAVVLSAVLLFVGLCSFNWFRTAFCAIYVPLILCLCCPLVLAIFFYALPAAVKKRAERDYKTYSEIMENCSLKFFDDNMIAQTRYLTLTDPYALVGLCIETPELFVLAKDSERMIVIPKRCVPEGGREDFEIFLRQVFARRRKVMKNWIF